MEHRDGLYTVPGMKAEEAEKVTAQLRERLNALSDLALTLKHVRWNVIGRYEAPGHTMPDPQVDGAREMADATAERIRGPGRLADGTPGCPGHAAGLDDCSVGRADAIVHLGALDVVYSGVIKAQRTAVDGTEEAGLGTQDTLIGQAHQLEEFQWFVRAHLEPAHGTLRTVGAATEPAAHSAPPGTGTRR